MARYEVDMLQFRLFHAKKQLYGRADLPEQKRPELLTGLFR
jgi:hypothetical protein